MFASRTVVGHLARGAIGAGALALAVMAAPAQPLVAALALPVALVALRGCPMCWTMGLVQTVAARLRGRSAEGACRDGSCALRGGRPPP